MKKHHDDTPNRREQYTGTSNAGNHTGSTTTDYPILKWRTQETKDQGTQYGPRRTAQTERMASTTSGLLQSNPMGGRIHDEKMLYAISLLRDEVGKWITPYTEELIPSTWENWAGFALELRSQFEVIDAKEEARITLKNMKQGRRSKTEYWNEFKLVASETVLDDSTAGEWLLGGMTSEMQNAWGVSSDKYSNITALANWAIEKETKLATVRLIQRNKTPATATRTNEVPRNPNRTYQQ